MPRPELTDITFVLDRSGSMQSIKQATIEAYNGFLASQKAGEGVAALTFVQFDDQFETIYRAIPLHKVAALTDRTYQPRASTALLDAMGRTILDTGKRLNMMSEQERPGTVIFATLTDGYENASVEFTLQRVNEMIREQRDKYSWQFIFLGANQDAIATAAQMGVDAGQAMTFSASPKGTQGVFAAFSEKLNRVRAARVKGHPCGPVEFDAEDRAASLD